MSEIHASWQLKECLACPMDHEESRSLSGLQKLTTWVVALPFVRRTSANVQVTAARENVVGSSGMPTFTLFNKFTEKKKKNWRVRCSQPWEHEKAALIDTQLWSFAAGWALDETFQILPKPKITEFYGFPLFLSSNVEYTQRNHAPDFSLTSLMPLRNNLWTKALWWEDLNILYKINLISLALLFIHKSFPMVTCINYIHALIMTLATFIGQFSKWLSATYYDIIFFGYQKHCSNSKHQKACTSGF